MILFPRVLREAAQPIEAIIDGPTGDVLGMTAIGKMLFHLTQRCEQDQRYFLLFSRDECSPGQDCGGVHLLTDRLDGQDERL